MYIFVKNSFSKQYYLFTREKKIENYIYIILLRRFNKYFITINKIISAFIRI